MNKNMMFNCHLCKKYRFYKNRISFLRAKRKNLKCNKCVQIGKKYPNRKSPSFTDEQRKSLSEKMRGRIPWNKGKVGIYSQNTIKKIREMSIGRKHTTETKNRISEKMKYRIISEETKRKNGIQSRINQLNRLNRLGIPPHEDIGCTSYLKELNSRGFDFNPKTFWKIGYAADGYDKQKHIWFEFDTPYHQRPYQQKKDLIRQKNIIDHFEEEGHPLTSFIRAEANKNGEVLKTRCVYGEGNII